MKAVHVKNDIYIYIPRVNIISIYSRISYFLQFVSSDRLPCLNWLSIVCKTSPFSLLLLCPFSFLRIYSVFYAFSLRVSSPVQTSYIGGLLIVLRLALS